MNLFATHFGFYEVEPGALGARLVPFRHDPDPSPIGQQFLELADHRDRILQPMARAGWLDGDCGAKRGDDQFIPLDMQQATRLAADALKSVRDRHGNRALFGGSYGWGSAGRFHHPQSQLKRFLNLNGGFVAARNTYSYGTAKVLIPHIVGKRYSDPGKFNPTWDRIVETKPFILSFGGMRLANAQVEAGGTGKHTTRDWLQRFQSAGGDMLTLSPDGRDAPFGQHLPIRAGTDAHAMLGIAHAMMSEGLHDEAFLQTFCTGWPQLRDLLLGTTDGQPKTPEWAEGVTGLEANLLKALARRLAREQMLLNLSWSIQRAYAGEQPYWAAIALAAMSGQLGRPGCGVALGLSAVSSVGNPIRPLSGPALEQGQNPVKDFIPVGRITEMLERPGGTIPYDGSELTLPDIKMIWWAGGNPFHHHQDLNRLARAWKRPETVIVHEHVWTATAKHADLVFPSAFAFERDDIAASSRDNWIVLSRQVQAPPPGIPTDHQCFADIAGHLGLREAFTAGLGEWDWVRKLYASYRGTFPQLPEWEAFEKNGYASLETGGDFSQIPQPLAAFRDDPITHPLETASGRIDLMPAIVLRNDARLGHPICTPINADFRETAGPSLFLLSPQPETRLHSQLDGASLARNDRINDRERARLNPADIVAAGLKSGETAELFNERGIVIVTVVADSRVAPGHVVLPTGGWYRPIKDKAGRLIDLGGNPNTLTADRGASGLSQGPSAGGSLVSMRPADKTAIGAL